MTRTLTSPLALAIRRAWDRETAEGRRLSVGEVAARCGGSGEIDETRLRGKERTENRNRRAEG